MATPLHALVSYGKAIAVIATFRSLSFEFSGSITTQASYGDAHARLFTLQSRRKMGPWIPKNFDEVCKRSAGRRKLHMRKRQARADRIVGLLAATDSSMRLSWERLPTVRSLLPLEQWK